MEIFCPMFSVIRGPIRRNKDDFFGNPFMRDGQKGIWPFRKRECGQNRKPEIEKKIVEDSRRLLKSSICIEKNLQFESFLEINQDIFGRDRWHLLICCQNNLGRSKWRG